jgi:hypothetical protein
VKLLAFVGRRYMLRCHSAPKRFAIMLGLVLLAGCASQTVLVRVPPQIDMGAYRTTGIVEFTSNADPALGQYATRQFQESVQAAQPGTRFIELGTREDVLDAIGAKQLDAQAIRKIGAKFAVDALFVGDLVYSEPKYDINMIDPLRMQAAVKSEVKGDVSSKLLETKSGASIWSSSAWAKRQLASMRVSAESGVSGRMSNPSPHHDMVPDMVHHLTHAFRATSVRQRVE